MQAFWLLLVNTRLAWRCPAPASPSLSCAASWETKHVGGAPLVVTTGGAVVVVVDDVVVEDDVVVVLVLSPLPPQAVNSTPAASAIMHPRATNPPDRRMDPDSGSGLAAANGTHKPGDAMAEQGARSP
ncbi:MAG: hypothetical protein WD598_01175 [Acidimicrobiia bacterium]